MKAAPKKEGSTLSDATPFQSKKADYKDIKKIDAIGEELKNCENELEGIEIPEHIKKIIEESRLDLTKEIPEPEPLMLIDGVKLFTRGNFSTVTGMAKSRKSFVCTLFVAAFKNPDGIGILTNPMQGSGKVLWIDTEQSIEYVALIGRRINTLLGRDVNYKDNSINIYVLRPYANEVKKQVVEYLLKTEKPDLCIIDGLADLIPSVNDLESCQALIQDLLTWTTEQQCHIIAVIHTNQKGENNSPRGHLGAEAVRKMETQITCVKSANNNQTTCEFTEAKGVRPQDFTIEINEKDGIGIPTILDYNPTEEAKRKQLENLFSDLLTHAPETTNKELVNKLMAKEKMSKKTAQNKIGDAVKFGLIIKTKKGSNTLYQIPPTETQETFDL